MFIGVLEFLRIESIGIIVEGNQLTALPSEIGHRMNLDIVM